MPRPAGKVPAYSLHKASGKAVVRLGGKDHYLGPYGSPESHERYERLIAEWRASHARAVTQTTQLSRPAAALTVNHVLLAYLTHAGAYYVDRHGKPTSELSEVKYSLKPVRNLYGRTPVLDFGPLALKAVREWMLDQDWSRKTVNNRVDRIKRAFRWAVAEELVPPSVYEAMRTVPGLRAGRTRARETAPVKPVPRAFVDAVLPYLGPPVAAMVELQWLTGMRPGEVVIMRACDLDTTGEVWLYRPSDHKTAWRGQERVVPLGPRAQEIVKRFLTTSTTAYLFSPMNAEAWRNQCRRLQRKTPMTPSQAKRKPKARPKRAKRERYDTSSYRRAIAYAVRAANRQRKEEEPEIPNWSPLQLRHSRATDIRRQFGLEAAQVTLGHTRADVTQVYAERDLAAAIRVAKDIG